MLEARMMCALSASRASRRLEAVVLTCAHGAVWWMNLWRNPTILGFEGVKGLVEDQGYQT